MYGILFIVDKPGMLIWDQINKINNDENYLFPASAKHHEVK